MSTYIGCACALTCRIGCCCSCHKSKPVIVPNASLDTRIAAEMAYERHLESCRRYALEPAPRNLFVKEWIETGPEEDGVYSDYPPTNITAQYGPNYGISDYRDTEEGATL